MQESKETRCLNVTTVSEFFSAVLPWLSLCSPASCAFLGQGLLVTTHGSARLPAGLGGPGGGRGLLLCFKLLWGSRQEAPKHHREPQTNLRQIRTGWGLKGTFGWPLVQRGTQGLWLLGYSSF